MRRPRLAAVVLSVGLAAVGRSALALDWVAGASPVADLVCPSTTEAARPTRRATSSDDLSPPDVELTMQLGGGDGDVSPAGNEPLAGALKPLGSIVLWGDSHGAARFFTDALLQGLGIDPADTAPSLVPALIGVPGVRLPIKKACRGGQWTSRHAHAVGPGHGPFGAALTELVSSAPGSFLWIDLGSAGTRGLARSFDLLLGSVPAGDEALIAISLDDGPEQFVSAAGLEVPILSINADRPVRVLKLRVVVGSLVVQGLGVHWSGSPSVQVDVLAIPGARQRGWRQIDADSLRRSPAAGRPYDLALLEYGTNEGNDAGFDPAAYQGELRGSLAAFRQAYPDVACVLIGPPDRGVLVPRSRSATPAGRATRGVGIDLLRYSRIHRRIGDIQRLLGREFGCGFWSWQEAMGGMGSAYRWYRATPALMAPDLTHLTVEGYRESAARLARFLRPSMGR